MRIYDAMKSEIDAETMEYDEKNDRFYVLNINTPFWVRLLFLLNPKHLFVIRHAKLLANKIRNKELNENQ